MHKTFKPVSFDVGGKFCPIPESNGHTQPAITLNSHTLRHTFASRLAMEGVTEGTIANLLRHSGTALVRRYAHLSPSYLQEAVEKVSSFGKVAKEPATTPTTTKQERESGEQQAGRAAETVSAIPTGPGTGKMGEEVTS